MSEPVENGDAPAGPPAPAPAHDVWGKVEAPAQHIEPKTVPEAQPIVRPEPAPAAEPPRVEFEAAPVPEPEPRVRTGPLPAVEDEAWSAPADESDVKVAPVPAGQQPEAPAWEGSLFEGGAREPEADPRYVAPTSDHGPGKSGKPSSGNWQMPDWMADEGAADAKLGTQDPLDDGDGRNRVVLFGGVGLLVVAVAAAGGVYLLKGRGDSGASEGKAHRPASAVKPPPPPQVEPPADKPLRRFPGKPAKVLGMVKDAHSGLAYPRLAAPWVTPTKKNKLGISGWSGQQILVTEKKAGQMWYGQLLTGTLIPTLQGAYKGPDSVKNVAALAAKGLEERYYGFAHKTAPLASQELTVDGHKGWLVASYLTYKRPPFKATGEIVATAVIDTGKQAPAVVFASMPNTHRAKWPDVNEFIGKMKVAS
ncbi:hypothetical protein ACRB68_51450 [Actinomadura sp. RB68]|uniref:Uncharacterized protein n=2 Tax=Actinomadura macrotermitis TaxID=2585200 RepID=A0A7K0C0Q6_9ACTN|nr:hypothetical protein [Actinomadura macrotermitis]